VANTGGPGADAAYDRAVAAFQQGAYDVARRWALEALAQDGNHDRARALLGRLDAVRRPAAAPAPTRTPAHASRPSTGSEVVSTDPTVLISRASGSAPPEGIEPTVLVRRSEPQTRRDDADVFAPVAPRGAAVSEPTMIVQRQTRTASSSSSGAAPPGGGGGGKRSAAAGAGGWFSQMFGRRPARPPARGASGNTRGILVAAAAMAAAAVLLIGGIAAARWMWPSGQTIRLTKPTGGTILGPGGLNCGTQGTDCETSRPTGEGVELIAQADENYVFGGFTGDCAPTGRMQMNGPKTCGATFNLIAGPPAAVTFPLTIDKPVGGTIIGPGDIICGSLGASCSASIPTGQSVTLRPQADDGYTLGMFTGDCTASGELTMTSAKTCGAAFTQTSTPVANVLLPDRSVPRPRRPVDVAPPPAKPQTATPPPSSAVVPPPAPPGGGAATPSVDQTVATPPPSEPAVRPETPEEHATKEIQRLVNDFCSAYESRDPEVVQKLWPLAPMGILRDQFRQYKTLRCTITAPPKFDRLDARPAGGAQIEFGMKQEIEARSGGAPQVNETIVTMVVSRIDFKSPWLVDRVRSRPKPKN
jgi:hypothetical protein